MNKKDILFIIAKASILALMLVYSLMWLCTAGKKTVILINDLSTNQQHRSPTSKKPTINITGKQKNEIVLLLKQVAKKHQIDYTDIEISADSKNIYFVYNLYQYTGQCECETLETFKINP